MCILNYNQIINTIITNQISRLIANYFNVVLNGFTINYICQLMFLSTHRMQLINGEAAAKKTLKFRWIALDVSDCSYYYCIDLTAGEHKLINIFMNDKRLAFKLLFKSTRVSSILNIRSADFVMIASSKASSNFALCLEKTLNLNVFN